MKKPWTKHDVLNVAVGGGTGLVCGEVAYAVGASQIVQVVVIGVAATVGSFVWERISGK